MKVLLWETSSVPWGIGLAEIDESGKSQLIAFHEDHGARTLAGNFIGALDGILQKSSISIQEINALAVSQGPGSWTGLRIGMTAAKTIALSNDIPLMGIPTFDVFAESLHRAEDGNAMLLAQAPCRPGERYAKLWVCHGGNYEEVFPEWIGSPEQIVQRVKQACSIVPCAKLITGGPSEKALELAAWESDNLELRKSTFEARLQAMARIAAQRNAASQWDDALKLQPIYLAPSAAEREFYAKQKTA